MDTEKAELLMLGLGVLLEFCGIVLAGREVAARLRGARKVASAQRDAIIAITSADSGTFSLSGTSYLSTEGELGVWKQRLEKAENDIDELHRNVAAAAQQGRGAALNVHASLKPQMDAVSEALQDSSGSGAGPYLSVVLIGLGLLLQAVASAMSIANAGACP
jgi:hypothetical protein